MATDPTSSSSLFNAIQFDAGAFGGNLAGLTGETAAGLIYAALRKAAVTLGPGRTPSPAQQQDAIDELRRLTGSLNCDRLFIFSRSTQAFPLTGATSYTIGQDPSGTVTADFDTPRPQLIESANILSSTTPEISWPLAIVDATTWAQLPPAIPTAPGIPEVLYNDRAAPISTLYLYGAPMAGYQLELFTWYQVPTYTSESDLVFLPLQYEDALVLNLACRLAPHFQRPVDPDVRQQARESLMRLMSINAPQPIADTSGLGCSGGRFNIYQG
jgi:hypothetical protein